MTSMLLAALKSKMALQSKPMPPLSDAAIAGDIEKAKKIISEDKPKIDQKDGDGCTALMHAGINDNYEMVQFLITQGARVMAKDDQGENVIMKCSKEGHLDLLKHLVHAALVERKKGGSGGQVNEAALENEKRRIIDGKDDEGVTALMKACEAGEYEVVRWLLENNANVEAKDDEQWTCLMWGALSGQLEICEMLIKEHGCAAGYATERGETPLMKASAGGHWPVCEILLEEKCKVNSGDSDYQTALMWAASEGHRDTVEGLVKHEAKTDLLTKTGQTALMLAARFGRREVVEYLCTQMKTIEQADEDGRNCVFHCVNLGDQSLIELMLDRTPSLIDKVNKKGETSLMLAACSCSPQFCAFLLDRKANLSKTDESGRTALDHAESTLNSSVVQMLRDRKRAEEAAEEGDE